MPGVHLQTPRRQEPLGHLILQSDELPSSSARALAFFLNQRLGLNAAAKSIRVVDTFAETMAAAETCGIWGCWSPRKTGPGMHVTGQVVHYKALCMELSWDSLHSQ